MPQLQIPCPSCKSNLNINDSMTGKPIQCPRCRHPFIVGGAAPIGAPPVPAPPLSAPAEDELALQSTSEGKDAGGPSDPTALDKCPYCGANWKKGNVNCGKCNYNVITQRRMKKVGGSGPRFNLDTTKLFIYAVIIGILFGIYWLGNNFDWLRRTGTEMYDNASRGAPSETDEAAMKRKNAASQEAGKVKD
ncbi:MAG TPA: hypothetical protein VEJ63_18945 [Planctomycetota bacterium]|nr:hypothetical protein [Planctomycetota bacterium]